MLKLLWLFIKRLIFFIGLITLALLFIKVKHGGMNITNGNVAHVKLYGPIYSSENFENSFIGSDAVISEDIIELLDEIENNSKIKAILLEINSPGGTPLASQEIAKRIAVFKKPVVAWVREIGTSGAYWVASASDYIVAHQLSITGSIGVLANSFGFEDILKKFNIKYRRQVAGDFKDIGSPFREESDEEKIYMQNVINEIHEFFINSFSQYRNIPYEEAKNIANGLFYTGQTALKHKLIDELGSKEEVNAWLLKTINETPNYVDYYKNSSWMKTFLKNFQGKSIGVIKVFFNTLINEKTQLSILA